jgi:YXWGXW repeat-containing protein
MKRRGEHRSGSEVLSLRITADLLHGQGQPNKQAVKSTQNDGVSIAAFTGMTKYLKIFAISALLLAPASLANAQVSFGIRIGEPPGPRAYAVPAYPGPGYEWVEGYWYPVHGRYVWRNGYWARPPYRGAYWSAPYYSGGRYYSGRWEGRREAIQHRNRENRERHQNNSNYNRR